MGRRFSHLDRKSQLAELETDTFDLVVVGGGITGAGIAFDATVKGLRVAILEKDDWGAGTSSKSSKLVHGGLRYLEQMEFGLVMESTAERAFLMKRVSHLVRPLRFIFPVYRSHKHRPWFIQLGMWLYDILALFRNHKRHRRLSPREVSSEEPFLDVSEMEAAMAYYDCITDDARLTLENAKAAHRKGAIALSRVEVNGLDADEDGLLRVAARDTWGGQNLQIRTRRVVNAAGPWTNKVLGEEGAKRTEVIRPTKGVHLVVPREALPVDSAVVVQSPRDGRIAFVIPWEESTAIGTTDTDFTGSPDEVHTSRADVDYLLEAIRAGFPTKPIKDDDIVSTWAGLRPLIKDDSENPYNTSREHEIIEDERGVFTIAGGKLTTYRKMAEECVDMVIASLGKLVATGEKSTKHVPLPGCDNFVYRTDGERVIGEVVNKWNIAHPVAERLVQRYGGQWPEILPDSVTDLPLVDPRGRVLEAEVQFGLEHEMVGSLEDFMARRTHLFYHLPDQGLEASKRVARILGQAFGWSEEEVESEYIRYTRVVEDNRRWKEEDLKER